MGFIPMWLKSQVSHDKVGFSQAGHDGTHLRSQHWGREVRMRSLSNVSLAVANTYPLAGTRDKGQSSLGKQGCVMAFDPELADFSGRKALEQETWVALTDTTNSG